MKAEDVVSNNSGAKTLMEESIAIMVDSKWLRVLAMTRKSTHMRDFGVLVAFELVQKMVHRNANWESFYRNVEYLIKGSATILV